MRRPPALRVFIRIGIGLFVLLAAILSIGMLPGKIEGAYRGLGVTCMCDSVNFMRFHDGQVAMYSSGHAPADLLGRYEKRPDGTYDVYMYPFEAGEPEKRIARVTPRLWFTKLELPDGSKTQWVGNSPIVGVIAATIREQEVESAVFTKESTIVTTFFDENFEKLRVEVNHPKRRRATDEADQNSARESKESDEDSISNPSD